MIITDLRGNNEANRDKYLCKLAEDILYQAMIRNYPPGVGQFIKKYGQRLNALGMNNLEAKHFEIAEWRIKKVLGNI